MRKPASEVRIGERLDLCGDAAADPEYSNPIFASPVAVEVVDLKPGEAFVTLGGAGWSVNFPRGHTVESTGA